MRTLFCFRVPMRLHLLCLLPLLLTGCPDDRVAEESPPDVDRGPETVTETETLREGPFDLEAAGVRFPIPQGWREVALTDNQQRIGGILHRLLVPSAGVLAEVTVSQLGGGAELGIERWEDFYPVKTPARLQVTIGDRTGTLIRLTGNLQDGEKDKTGGKRLIGFALPLDDDGQVLYVKLSGPAAAVTSAADAFRDVIESATPTENE